ncbi:unnamed protein product [Pieris macdunnoughi]|uniref:Uncharacterized protein n=1 Tax=Pieris macdunnoughi TaxID=345717 RepID=A0A821RL80_9NEOP|nr:unnamed protein product [Pieris macdunnoughi]
MQNNVRADAVRLGRRRAHSWAVGDAGAGSTSIAAHAALRPSAPRVVTRVPGCAPRRWRRERAPAAPRSCRDGQRGNVRVSGAAAYVTTDTPGDG